MPPQLLTIRKASVDHATQIAELFQTVYGESSNPCKNPQHIRDSILEGSTRWWVAVDGDGVIGCGSSIVNEWNRSWELGGTVTLPEYRGAGVATSVMQEALEEACASPRCDLLIGFPRSRTMLTIARGMRPAFHPVGHDGATNVSNGVREYHTIVFAANPDARFRHYIPPCRSLAHCEFVWTNIFHPLGYHPEAGEYPEVWLAGSDRGYRGLGPFSFEYDPHCPSRALEVTGCNFRFRDAQQAATTLLQKLNGFPDVLHVRLAVPVDKIGFIAHLMDAGFEITSYLPAWYCLGGARYDCVLLVRRSFHEEPTDHDVRDVVGHFRHALNGCRGTSA